MSGPTINGDQLIAVREAVADVQKQLGLGHLAERILRGELDGQPIMLAAIAAVERVLRGMFG
jgi:hypothetical protein